MAKLSPFKFLQEVRQETNKVTWPSRKETGITTAMVFIFAAISAVFFLIADQIIRIFVTTVLDIGDQREIWYWIGGFFAIAVIAAIFSNKKVKDEITIIFRIRR